MPRSSSALLSSTKLSATNFSTLILCVLILSALSFAAAPDRITGAVLSSQTVTLAKSLHPKAQSQYDLGPADPSRQLSYITLLMAPSASQQKALDRLLAQQQDPKSPNYHKWLTPQQYADRFGLSQNDLVKVITWLASQGFQILSIGGGRDSVIFSGTAALVQRAFGTEIHNYKVDGEEHFANSTPVMIPAALSGIVTGVIGLHDFRLQPASGGRRFIGRGNGFPEYYDGNYIFPNFLAPDDVATIYDIAPLYKASTPIDGTGQKLAIVGQSDIYLADINDFRSGFGLSTIPTTGAGACTTDANGIVVAPCTTTNFAYVLLGTDPHVPFAGDLGESDLDIEWSGAVARNAQIVFVNGETAGGVLDALSAVINPPTGPPLAPVVSMSYGECEAFGGFDLETLLQQGNAEGVTIVNSSGDAGSATCDRNPPNNTRPFNPAVNGLAVSYPASSPEVTGVGGTAISLANDSYPTPSPFWSTTLGTNGGTAVSYIPELAWNDDEELALYCHSPANGDTFCSTGGGTTGWVPLTSSATAAQVQSDIWINQGGGGASNCWYTDTNGICLGAGPGPTGGGFAQPQYQLGLTVPNAPAGVRYVPDVSLLASPNFPGYIFCTAQSELIQGGGSTSSCVSGIFQAVDSFGSLVGGTSVSSPVFAGIVALLNQDVVVNGVQSAPGLGNINPTLYHLAANNPTAFHQVATGDNTVYCQPGTPAGYPPGIVCPAGGSFGYAASNKDSVTGYNLVTGLGSVDAHNLLAAWIAASLASTTTTVTSSQNPANFGASVTFTATVTTTGANPPTGTVTIYDGTTALGSGILSGGATAFALSTSSLTAGTHSITAVYGGDASNTGSTSAVLTQTINPATFTLVSTGSSSHTVLSGQTTLNYSFLVTPTSGSTFVSAVNFSCTSFSPTDPTLTSSSCAFSPSATIAAGKPASTVTMTISSKGPNSGTGSLLRHRSDNRLPWLPLTLPLAGVVMVGFARRKMSTAATVAGMCLMLVLAGFLIACGSSSPPVSITSVTGSSSSIYPQNVGWTNATATFTAVLANDSGNKGVTWAVTTPNGGTIVSADATHGTYTPPTIAAGLPSNVTITATSVADTSKTGTASIALNPTTVPNSGYNVTVNVSEAGALSQATNVTLVVK
jgi:Pro-kumamolisin, activation domain/Bacterial Ig-like domain (group 3)